MIDEVRKLLDEYLLWLRARTTLREIDGWVEISTPFLDRHNDYLAVYARRDNGGFLLSDDGYIIGDLEQSGCSLNTEKRATLLEMTLNGFGVSHNGPALEVHATPQTFALQKHNLVQAMLAVNDLFYLATPTVTSLFLEDVEAWLEASEIRATPRVKFSGKSGFDHLFDFVIPKSTSQPERVLKAINAPNRTAAQTLAFAWFDTQHVRPENSCAYAVLNDEGRSIQPGVVDALSSYDVRPFLWSDRERVREELAA